MERESGEAKLRRQLTQRAITLAMRGWWEEAVKANKGIIEIFPNDVSACNRLGKALTEIGSYEEARKAYDKAIEIDPRCSIARRNLHRLSVLGEEPSAPPGTQNQVVPDIFIEEVGKAAVASLKQLASREVLAKVTAGAPVSLTAKGKSVIAENSLGQYLGEVEPRIGTRLAKLIEGGNRYTAVITSATDNEVKIIIREVFQHPSQAGRPSFPAKGSNGFRPYIRNSILKYELEDEESPEEAEYTIEQEEGELPQSVAVLAETDDDAKDAVYGD